MQLSRRKRPKRGSLNRIPASIPQKQNERWGMDFMCDRLEDGRRFRILTMVDLFTRKSPKIWADFSITAEKLVKQLENIKEEHGLPRMITVDNGPEFVSSKLDSWAYYYGIKLDFIRPGKPVDNTFTESFNSRLRDECLIVA